MDLVELILALKVIEYEASPQSDEIPLIMVQHNGTNSYDFKVEFDPDRNVVYIGE